jgi:hypothetical protein
MLGTKHALYWFLLLNSTCIKFGNTNSVSQCSYSTATRHTDRRRTKSHTKQENERTCSYSFILITWYSWGLYMLKRSNTNHSNNYNAYVGRQTRVMGYMLWNAVGVWYICFPVFISFPWKLKVASKYFSCTSELFRIVGVYFIELIVLRFVC